MTRRSSAQVEFVVRLPAPMHAALKARAQEEERTMAVLVRRALRTFLGMKGDAL